MKDNREKLLEAARQEVQQSGFKALSFRTLADEIGIKSSSVHYHFPEKSDLAQEIIHRYSEDFFATLEQISSSRSGLKRKITEFIGVFEAVAKEDKLCLCGSMVAEVPMLSGENRKALSHFFMKMEQWLVDELTTHKAEIAIPLTPAQLAKAMSSGLEGALLVDRVDGNNDRIKAQKALFLNLLS